MAAITAGALYSKYISQTGPLLVLPSDHYIKSDQKKFHALIKKTMQNDITDKLVCFGIQSNFSRD
ncbi:MAG: hypothetical protein ACJ0G9_07340 [Alphaproteobacteria bacterium]